MTATASASILKHPGVKWIAIGWVGFMTENVVVSHNRDYLIRNFGDDEYHILYNILSTAACSSIAYGFLRYGKFGGAMLPRKGPALQAVGFAVQALGLVGLSQLAPALQIPVAFGTQQSSSQNIKPSVQADSGSVAQKEERKMYVRCPIDFRPKNSEDGIYGVERITRHPALWFMGFSLLGSAITTVFPAHLVMFSFPTVFAYIGGEHQDYRYRRGSGGMLPKDVDSITSNVPFAAVVTGKQDMRKVLEEMKWTNAVLALLAALAVAARRLK